MSMLSARYLILGLYSLLMVGITIYGYKKSNESATAYSVASKSFGLFPLLALFFGGFVSSVALTGYTAFAYDYGFSYFTAYALGCSCGWLFLQLLSPKLYKMEKQWMTTPEVMGERYYSTSMRSWMAFVNYVYTFLYIIMGLTGGGILISGMLDCSYLTGLTIISVIVLLYTSLGGMYSVSATTNIQATILFVFTMVIGIGSFRMAGGWGNIISSLEKIDPALITATGNFPLTLISGLTLGVATGVTSSTWYHRMVFTAKSRKLATSFFGIGTIFMFLAYIAYFVMGASVRVINPNLSSGEYAFNFLLDKLPASLSIFAAVLAISAIQAALDGNLLAAGSMVANDAYLTMKPNCGDKKLLKVAQLGTLGTGLLAFAISAFRPAMIITIYDFAVAIVSSSIFAPMFIGLFWKRATKEGALAGSIVGFVVAALWFFFGSKAISACLVGIPTSIILEIIISLATAEPSEEVVKQFFNS